MAETIHTPEEKTPIVPTFQFGREINIEGSGFSFHPIFGFELEIDGSVYMYSECGSVEIFMTGGLLEDETSITELTNTLTSEFMENVGAFELIESDKDVINGTTGFLNEIHFSGGEEEGKGCVWTCKPYDHQFFCMLMIANAEYWQLHGESLFEDLKSQVNLSSLFQAENYPSGDHQYPDLSIETYQAISADDNFVVRIKKGDFSFLLASRTETTDQSIVITEILSPDGTCLYHYEPDSDDLSSTICNQPLTSTNGEVCFFYPRSGAQQIKAGDYQFTFDTSGSSRIQELKIIIRRGRALDLQKIDLNFWFASERPSFIEPTYLDHFEANIRQALEQQLSPVNLSPGIIECFQPAMEEIASFSSINLDKDLGDCSYMMAESVNNKRALNIGLVDHIIDSKTALDGEVDAISSGIPGMILSPGSPHTCIMICWPTFEEDIHSLAGAIIQQLIVFSGIDTKDIQPQESGSPFILNQEVAWRLRRHPLFYDAD